MKVKVQKSIGGSILDFEVENQSIDKAMFEAGCVASMPTVCGMCQSDSVSLVSNVAKSAKGPVEYVKVRCNKCGATSTMGKYQGDKGVFWHQFDKWNGEKSVDVMDLPE